MRISKTIFPSPPRPRTGLVKGMIVGSWWGVDFLLLACTPPCHTSSPITGSTYVLPALLRVCSDPTIPPYRSSGIRFSNLVADLRNAVRTMLPGTSVAIRTMFKRNGSKSVASNAWAAVLSYCCSRAAFLPQKLEIMHFFNCLCSNTARAKHNGGSISYAHAFARTWMVGQTDVHQNHHHNGLKIKITTTTVLATARTACINQQLARPR